MKKIYKKSIFVFFLLIAVLFSSFALDVPQLTGPVVDNANLFSTQKLESLSQNLRGIYENGGPQIVVLTIKTLDGESIENFSINVAEKWKIGSKESDNGVILTVALEERKIRIEVGYGLEGELTDAKCSLIIRNIMAPEFRNENYADGIIKAVSAIEKVLSVSNDDDTEILSEDSGKVLPSFYIIMAFFGFIYFFIFTGLLSMKLSWLKWLPWAPLFRSAKVSGKSYSSKDDFWGGSGFSGSHHSGGGFSGGGGGFGGGGASGGW